MVDATPFLPGLSPVQGKAVVARFDGGRLSSEGGLLALREIERRLGLANRLAACLKDPRAPEKVVHGLAEIIRPIIGTLAAVRIDLVGTTADFRGFSPSLPFPINHLLCENRRTASRIGEDGLTRKPI
jgi:hypothetical protein